ncbi:MAG: NAD(+) synthase [Planctomycetaceae bacterium]|jgi:NAD+ synthase (glutamine-hydrolysing)|nr:NAD(+) synthase [Planctomycetaceae bacterium]
MKNNPAMTPHFSPQQLDAIENALVGGIRDFLSQTGFSRCHLGLSGGIDSALTAYLAVRAVGKENVTCLILPTRFTSQRSLDDAVALANQLGCRHETISIEPVFTCFLEAADPLLEGRTFDTTEENLQARIRGTLLMVFANKFRSMLLATGNKSESAMGYCTLYGDTCGGLAPIGDLFKTDIFSLCRRINEKNNIIPQSILTKPPSAELRPNQTDQDSLPPYEVLDAVLKLYFDHPSPDDTVPEKIARELGLNMELVTSIIQTFIAMEFKRRQAPPILTLRQKGEGYEC